MSKRRWYGRPNRPPENWHTPDKPAVRSVAGPDDPLDEDVPAAFPLVGDGQNGVALCLLNVHWKTLLKLLHLYGQDYDDTTWQVWRLGIRRTILDHVEPNTDEQQPVAVCLSVKDWR